MNPYQLEIMHEPISDKGAGFRSLAPSDKKKTDYNLYRRDCIVN